MNEIQSFACRPIEAHDDSLALIAHLLQIDYRGFQSRDACQQLAGMRVSRSNSGLLLFLAGAGAGDVDGGEGPLVRNLAVENQFGIAGARNCSNSPVLSRSRRDRPVRSIMSAEQ